MDTPTPAPVALQNPPPRLGAMATRFDRRFRKDPQDVVSTWSTLNKTLFVGGIVAVVLAIAVVLAKPWAETSKHKTPKHVNGSLATVKDLLLPDVSQPESVDLIPEKVPVINHGKHDQYVEEPVILEQDVTKGSLFLHLDRVIFQSGVRNLTFLCTGSDNNNHQQYLMMNPKYLQSGILDVAYRPEETVRIQNTILHFTLTIQNDTDKRTDFWMRGVQDGESFNGLWVSDSDKPPGLENLEDPFEYALIPTGKVYAAFGVAARKTVYFRGFIVGNRVVMLVPADF